ncbi:MAG TPA: SDR family oxidoreductase [Bryobacteraceae bacterium]|nr:SDR family oxidoreductase [Bryobacteraceae bacterium]
MGARVVVVTGASGALGRAVVSAFASAGDVVIGVARSTDPYAADLTDATAASEVFDRILSDHGRIDVLAHSAGAFAGGSNVESADPSVWPKMLAINLTAAVNSFRAVLPAMRKAGKGKIVAVGSRSGAEPGAGAAAYNASKAALHALVRTTALECTGTGITCNAVLPGTMDTEANRGWGSPEQVATWVKPESVAATIVWLASDEAGETNGALLPVYGRS